MSEQLSGNLNYFSFNFTNSFSISYIEIAVHLDLSQILCLLIGIATFKR